MCDIEVALWLSRAVAPGRRTRIVWCGDPDQLPSVGAGQVLADLIASGVVPTTHLLEIFRRAVESPIIRNAHRDLQELARVQQRWTARHAQGPVQEAALALSTPMTFRVTLERLRPVVAELTRRQGVAAQPNDDAVGVPRGDAPSLFSIAVIPTPFEILTTTPSSSLHA